MSAPEAAGLTNEHKWRQLANGEDPYAGGPFDADHIKVFSGDARRLLAELDRLRAVERRATEYVVNHPCDDEGSVMCSDEADLRRALGEGS